MPIFTPKHGDTIHTENGDKFTCAAIPDDVLKTYPGTQIYGAHTSGFQTWTSNGDVAGRGPVIHKSSKYRIVAVLSAQPYPHPQPGDIITTENGQAWVCCTLETLRTTYGLALDPENAGSPIYAYRPIANAPGLYGVSWMSWDGPADSPVDGYEITHVSQARCNRKNLHGRMTRDDLIAYIQTLPGIFTIDKDGYVCP